MIRSASIPPLLTALAVVTLSVGAKAQGPASDPRLEIRAALEQRAPFPVGAAELPTLGLLAPGRQTPSGAAIGRERSLHVREEATARAVDSARKAVKVERTTGKPSNPGSERSSEGQAQSAAGRERANEAKKNGPLHGGPPRL